MVYLDKHVQRQRLFCKFANSRNHTWARIMHHPRHASRQTGVFHCESRMYQMSRQAGQAERGEDGSQMCWTTPIDWHFFVAVGTRHIGAFRLCTPCNTSLVGHTVSFTGQN